jgi:hypothetical protein
MNRILGAAKATYNFFAGDAILLTAVALAFIVGTLLIHVLNAPNALSAVVFVAFIVGGLVTTLGREVQGRPRSR